MRVGGILMFCMIIGSLFRVLWLNHKCFVSINPSDSYLIYYAVRGSEITARYCCNARNLQGSVLILCLGGHCNPWK